MATDVVGELFDQGYQLQEEKANWQERNAAVRSSLRNLAKSGVLSDDQMTALDELYPPRRASADE